MPRIFGRAPSPMEHGPPCTAAGCSTDSVAAAVHMAVIAPRRRRSPQPSNHPPPPPPARVCRKPLPLPRGGVLALRALCRGSAGQPWSGGGAGVSTLRPRPRAWSCGTGGGVCCRMELGRSAAKMQPGVRVTFEDVAKIELAEMVHILGEEGGREKRERERASVRALERESARAHARARKTAREREREPGAWKETRAPRLTGTLATH